ncbi:MAG: serine/threonine protein kinase [Deltaproteobacteria bacterium]|nr:serine/threonine protein kinase [Deltaproteobacteria bacterium]
MSLRQRTTSRRAASESSTDPSAAAVPRLAALAGVLTFIAVVYAISTTLVHFDILSIPFPHSTAINYAGIGVGVVAALVMIGITRTKLSPERILAFGLWFQVIGGLCISIAEQQSTRPGVPLVSIWILTFTLLPVSPHRAAFAAFATAATVPIAIMAHVALGNRELPTSGMEWLPLLGAVVAAHISSFITRVMYGLGRQAEQARRLGAYELIEELGHGGMGEVWRAQHHSLIRPAAVKLLRRELTSRLSATEREALNARFQREVQATAMLTSPHTIAVFDFGHTHDGTLYYVMELLHGLDVESLVEKHGPVPAERVIYLLRQACDSLAEAHRRNLIHRDVKPANIYLCAVGLKVDFVKILDFGLVRDLRSDMRLTSEGSVSGTPAYLAPEAAAHNQFDARGDIYALGCVAYFMLTGQLVFEAETSAGMIAAHIRDQPAAPSKRSELPIPPALDEVVLACLAKKPEDRPQTAEELQELLNAIPVATPWNQTRALGWWSVNVPALVESACKECDAHASPPPVRRRPAPVVRDTVGL